MTGKRSSLPLAMLTLALGSALAACGDDGGTAAPDEPLIHRTIVTRHEDGTETVRRFDVTLAEHLQDLELRELYAKGQYTAAVVRDSSCAAASMWLFDHTGSSGPNQICFIMTPKSASWQGVNLADYQVTYFGSSWAGKVRSFFSGEDQSLFLGTSPLCADTFGAFVRRDTVSACVARAINLSLSHP
jgi:hypothetical protein